MSRVFHPWEGGEGKVTGQYVTSLIQMAREHIRHGEYDRAIVCLTRARKYPHNLGEGKLLTVPETDVFYYLGLAYELRGDVTAARQYFEAGIERGSLSRHRQNTTTTNRPKASSTRDWHTKSWIRANWRDPFLSAWWPTAKSICMTKSRWITSRSRCRISSFSKTIFRCAITFTVYI